MKKENIVIPKGNSKQDRAARRSIIKKQLESLVGSTMNCPCLGNVPVELTPRGLNETIHHASKSYNSTMAALRLREHLSHATLYKYRVPKDNRQRRKMGFTFTIELHDKCDGKIVKIMVGVTIKPQYFHYCITAEE